VLEVGCSFGFLIERCNVEGIDAFGLDLPVENLKIPMSLVMLLAGILPH
jgi:hypothetical protein